jgi:hypothetical protein
MEITQGVFTFIVALAAVINGLGIVRIVGGLGEFLRRRDSLDVSYYWVHSLLALFQLTTHVLIWWALIGLRDVGSINFLQYLYVLLGPTMLFLATSLLVPEITDNKIDLRANLEIRCLLDDDNDHLAADRKCKNPRGSGQRQLAIADRLYQHLRDATGWCESPDGSIISSCISEELG